MGKKVEEKIVESEKDQGEVQGESSSLNLPFVLSHLPPPDRQMSIYGLVVKENETSPDEGMR